MDVLAYVYVINEEDYMIQEVSHTEDPYNTMAYDALYHDLEDHVFENMKIYKTVISLDNAELVE